MTGSPIFTAVTLVCGAHSHCPNPPRVAMGSLNAHTGEVHIADNTVLEATTGSCAAAGEL